MDELARMCLLFAVDRNGSDGDLTGITAKFVNKEKGAS